MNPELEITRLNLIIFQPVVKAISFLLMVGMLFSEIRSKLFDLPALKVHIDAEVPIYLLGFTNSVCYDPKQERIAGASIVSLKGWIP